MFFLVLAFNLAKLLADQPPKLLSVECRTVRAGFESLQRPLLSPDVEDQQSVAVDALHCMGSVSGLDRIWP